MVVKRQQVLLIVTDEELNRQTKTIFKTKSFPLMLSRTEINNLLKKQLKRYEEMLEEEEAKDGNTKR